MIFIAVVLAAALLFSIIITISYIALYKAAIADKDNLVKLYGYTNYDDLITVLKIRDATLKTYAPEPLQPIPFDKSFKELTDYLSDEYDRTHGNEGEYEDEDENDYELDADIVEMNKNAIVGDKADMLFIITTGDNEELRFEVPTMLVERSKCDKKLKFELDWDNISDEDNFNSTEVINLFNKTLKQWISVENDFITWKSTDNTLSLTDTEKTEINTFLKYTHLSKEKINVIKKTLKII